MSDKQSDFQNKGREVEEGKSQEEAEDLEQIPEDEFPSPPKLAKAMMSMMRVSASPSSPILEKLNESHINKIIESTDKDSERAFLDASSARKYGFFYFIIGVVTFVGLTVYLVDRNVSVYQEILKTLIIFGGGFGSGIGFKGYLDRKK